jgi:SNF2 family DNA or RNA helicase
VWFTLSYSREEYDQFNARVIRTGQKEETKIFHLVVPNTIDDAVLATIESKGLVQSGLLRTLRNIQVVVNSR